MIIKPYQNILKMGLKVQPLFLRSITNIGTYVHKYLGNIPCFVHYFAMVLFVINSNELCN